MIKWEYKAIHLDYNTIEEAILEELNKNGLDGWELVSVITATETPGYDELCCIFKRQLFEGNQK